MKPRIDVVFFDAGGGHRAAASALQLICQREGRPWDMRLVHLKDILDSIDVFRKITRIDLQEIYNLMLRKGWTLGSAHGLLFMHAVIRAMHRPAVRLLRDFWKDDPPAMVVSVIPNFNCALYEAFQQAAPGRPYVTLLTDLADFPPHFWIERQEQYFICGTPKAVEQARTMGHSAERIYATSGMILHPRFYEPVEVDPRAERARLGLDPERKTGLVLFGGYGSAEMRVIQQSLREHQLIFIAGKNEALRLALCGEPNHHVEGFTARIPYFMRICDYFIGKPGPGSLSEAIHFGLPAITVRNAWTLPQERYNADWLNENHLGVVLSSFKDVASAFALIPDSIKAPPNRALFEIPEILARILESS
jgi:hypothetical protein